MKFFVAIVLVAFVALASAAEESAAPAAPTKLEPVKEIEPSANAAADQTQQARGKRGFVLGAYTAPAYTAAYSAPYAAPVAYSYAASLPYAYQPYASYYSYPAVYV